MITRLARFILLISIVSVSHSWHHHRISVLKNIRSTKPCDCLAKKHCIAGRNYVPYRSTSQLFAHGDDKSSNQGKKSLVSKVITFARNIIAASAVTFFSVSSAWARKDIGARPNQVKEKRASSPSKSGKTTSQKLTKEVPKKRYEVILEIIDDSKEMLNSDLLNKIGIGAVGLTVLGALLKGDDAKPSKSKKTLRKIPTITRQEMLNDLKPSDSNSLVNVRDRLKDRLKSSYSDPTKLPDMDTLFEDEETADIVAPPTKPKVNKIRSFAKEAAVMEEDDRVADPPAPEHAAKQAPAPAPVPTPAPAPPAPQKKGFFDRIFKRSGSSRPTNIDEALRSAGDPSYSYRMAVIEGLVNYVRPSHVDEWAEFYSSDEFVEEKTLANINKFKDISGLSPQEAADAFAEVANAMLVTLVDTAVNTMDHAKSDNATIDSVDVITDFIGGAGLLFSKCLDKVAIEPVQYSGKVKKGKLENLYYIYAKKCVDLSSMLSLTGLQPAPEVADDSAASNAEEKLERLGRLQQVLSIKESKHSSVLQRVLREAMMDMKQDGSDLGGMFDALKGGDMSEMMNALGGMGGMPGADGMPGPDFEKELENMSEKDKVEMAKLAVGDVSSDTECCIYVR
jgi:hypothetical protein